jgi:hypothetical protein
MATQYVTLRGIAKWAKLREDNLAETFEVTRAELDFYPDPASMILLKNTGSMVEVKEDEDGKFVKFRRPRYVKFKDRKTGEEKTEDAGLPRVGMGLDENGNLIPYDGLIGNGSKVDVKIAVRPSKFGKSTRLEAVNILDLVEYSPEKSDPSAPYKF